MRYSFGALLCGLLLVYALGAKLALYHSGQAGARSVAATKAWQDHEAPAVEIAPVVATLTVAGLGAVLPEPVFAPLWSVTRDVPVMSAVRGFLPDVSVRPPPIG